MEREDVDTLIKECCDEEDADGFVPYERKLHFFSWNYASRNNFWLP